MQRIKFNQGFSILEVVIALSLSSLISLAVFKLQYITLANSKQSLIRQKVMYYSDSMISQLRAIQLGDNQINSLFLNNSYTSYSNAYSKCSKSICNKNDFSQYIINEWKMNLTFDRELANANIKALICHDTPLNIPNMDTPNCDGNINSPLVMKVIWATQGDEDTNHALNTRDNYIVFRVSL